MCCVVGYVGNDVSRERVCEGLLRLEYRGYDSAGFACLTATRDIAACKALGGVQRLRAAIETSPIDGAVGIGHTRWATNGSVTELNAHPVFDCTHSCAVVHNGIIDGEAELRASLLQRGHTFSSQTDTELIAHLFEEEMQKPGVDLTAVVLAVVAHLQGAYAFVVMLKQYPDLLIAVRRRSPLCIGFSDDGSYVASDPIAFANTGVSRVLFLPDESCAIVRRSSVQICSFNGLPIETTVEPFAGMWEATSLHGYPHYMTKELFEQQSVLTTIARLLPKELAQLLASTQGSECAEASEYLLFGCGTSYHAAHIARLYIQEIIHVPAHAVVASELRHQECIIRGMTWGLCFSQSGETADALEAMRHLASYGVGTVGIVNRAISTIAREAHMSLILHAGHEVSVGSTKTFTAHLAVSYLFAHAVAAYKNGKVVQRALEHPARMIGAAAQQLQKGIERSLSLIEQEIAPLIVSARRALIIGRKDGYALAQELALKLKEIAYIFAEACYAGELKHGPLALIDGTIPIIVCMPLEKQLYTRMLSSVHEAKLRGGKIIALCFAHQHEIIALAHHAVIVPTPQDPLLATLIMAGVVQYIAYAAARIQDLPIDRPRNLAKSVTVE